MKKIDEILREVGIITLKFSKLEHLALEYISVLLSGNANLTNYMLFQDQTLDSKLKTIKNLIYLNSTGHQMHLQLETIKKIENLKNERNLFIHGDWDDIQVAVENNFETLSVRSIKYKFEKKNDGSKSWTPGKKDSYSIERFKKMNEEIDSLLIELGERITENKI